MEAELRASKLARLDEPHVAPLNRLVRQWREDGRLVPWFDPDGGGTRAEVLLLMQSPGPATVTAGEDAVTTEDNDDPTARSLRAARTSAGLDRRACLRWNVVPWALAGSRPPTVADLEDARPELGAVVDRLTALRVVVAFGTKALDGWMRLLTLDPTTPLVPTLAVPHPSPANGHRRAESEDRVCLALRRAASLRGKDVR